MQEAEYAHKAIRNEQTGHMVVPDWKELLAKYNRQESERNADGITPDLTVKAGKIFMLFNKEIQSKMMYIKSLGLASTVVEKVIAQIVLLDYDSIVVDIGNSHIQFVINFKERGFIFEIYILHDEYQLSTDCRVILRIVGIGKASKHWTIEISDINTKINREML